MIRKIGVLADDFTGAADVALAFVEAGWPTEINVPLRNRGSIPDGEARVWVIDTETRNASPVLAARRVRAALRRLSHWNPDFYFKKMDSTLRGPLSAEMRALMDVLSPQGPISLVPAFPQMGRTTLGGVHLVDGVPVHRTAFGRDPRFPVRSSYVAEAVGGRWVDRIEIPDIALPRDLDRVARRAIQSEVAVGSAGFAQALARAARRGGPASAPPRAIYSPMGGPSTIGVVVGSAHPATVRQTRAAVRAAVEGVSFFCAPRRRQDPKRVLGDLIARAHRWGSCGHVRRWVATGGETAFALVRRWNRARWRVAGKIERGIPLLVSIGRNPILLVSKPGGFGSQKALIRAIQKGRAA